MQSMVAVEMPKPGIACLWKAWERMGETLNQRVLGSSPSASTTLPTATHFFRRFFPQMRSCLRRASRRPSSTAAATISTNSAISA